MVLGEGSRSGNDAVLRIAREQGENGSNRADSADRANKRTKVSSGWKVQRKRKNGAN